MKNSTKKLFKLSILFVLASCSSSQMDRMEWLGKEPPISDMQPKQQAEPIKWPQTPPKKALASTANSLWDSRSKAFFSDQRASAVGDILTVRVAINDKAQLDNKTEQKRTEKDTAGAPAVFGLEDQLVGWLPGKANPTSLLNTSAATDNKGEGAIERAEVIETDVAAVVTDVLPNGNLVIYGSQEVRVNYEVRQLTVQGVIRPEDISPKNDVDSSLIAEARISYGGKGIIMDIQQPRLGRQVADILSPF